MRGEMIEPCLFGDKIVMSGLAFLWMAVASAVCRVWFDLSSALFASAIEASYFCADWSKML